MGPTGRADLVAETALALACVRRDSDKRASAWGGWLWPIGHDLPDYAVPLQVTPTLIVNLAGGSIVATGGSMRDGT
jgi:hypothetical protein